MLNTMNAGFKNTESFEQEYDLTQNIDEDSKPYAHFIS